MKLQVFVRKNEFRNCVPLILATTTPVHSSPIDEACRATNAINQVDELCVASSLPSQPPFPLERWSRQAFQNPLIGIVTIEMVKVVMKEKKKLQPKKPLYTCSRT